MLETIEAPPAASYRRLLNARGFAPLLASALLTRTAEQMWAVATVLFALQRYHSASVAGLAIFLLIFPGLAMSPINGALLDRHGRRRLMTLNFVVAAACLALIVVFAATDRLPVWLLLLLLSTGSLTSSFSFAGARSLFPLTVPTDLWDRANAADSLCYSIAQIAGSGLAGWLTAAFGSESAFTAAAIAYIVAIVALRFVPEPRVVREVTNKLLRDVWRGVRYVVSNRTLRWLAVSASVGNIGWGIVVVALPLLVFRLHGDAAVVGGLLALQALVGIPAAIAAGRVKTLGRERQIIAVFSVIVGIATLALLTPALAGVALAVAFIGAAEGPLNVTMFSLRQRRTRRSWFGRAFAISMSLNFAGMPLGSAISGPILNASITLAVVIAAVLAVASAAVVVKIPANDQPWS
jgi:MFS family permease